MTVHETVSVDEIEVGDRARTDLGDLTELMESIRELDLLQPIVVTADRRLIAGGRRLEACRQLGKTEVPVVVAEHITDAITLLKAERDENTCRKDMTPSELVAIGRALEKLKKPGAEARKRAGQKRGAAITNGKIEALGFPKKPKRSISPDLAAELESGRTDVIVGKALGMSQSIYYRARTVVQAAELGDERAAEAVAHMDRTGKITPAYNQWREHPTAPSGSNAEPPAPAAPPLTSANGRRYPQRSQRKAYAELMATLTGLCAGVARDGVADLDDSHDAEEVAQWTRDLSTEVLPVLRSLNKKFKEHGHGNH